MWRKMAALILMMAVWGSTFNRLIVMLDYHFNQKFIAATLCENRDKPASCCKGKCFLKKQLQKEEEPGKSNLPQSKEQSQVFFCEQYPAFFFRDEMKTPTQTCYLYKKYAVSLTPVFHPPGKA
jgi:hypothetical protein